MATPISKYTEEELYNNYEFKVVKRAIIREFPWIKNVFVDPRELSSYNLIFLNFDCDPAMLAEQEGYTLTRTIQRAIDENLSYMAIYLSMFYTSVEYDTVGDITDEIIKLIKQISKSPALPQELKLLGGRSFGIGNFFLNRGQPPV